MSYLFFKQPPKEPDVMLIAKISNAILTSIGYIIKGNRMFLTAGILSIFQAYKAINSAINKDTKNGKDTKNKKKKTKKETKKDDSDSDTESNPCPETDSSSDSESSKSESEFDLDDDDKKLSKGWKTNAPELQNFSGKPTKWSRWKLNTKTILLGLEHCKILNSHKYG